MMGWKVVTFAPRRLLHDSFLLERILLHILVVSMASNTYHDDHFCSHHSDGPFDPDNTAVAADSEVVDYCFPTQAPYHNHCEFSMSANVYCIHYHSVHEEEELNYCSMISYAGCNRHVDDTAAVDAQVVAALFLHCICCDCCCCEESNLDVVTDIDVAEAGEDDDVSQNDHKMKTEEEGPSLPSRYFAEVMSIRTHFESFWVFRNYDHGYDWSVMSSVSYCRLA